MTVIETPAPSVTAPERRRLMGDAYDLSGATDVASARVLAGLDWEPEHRPLYVNDNHGIADAPADFYMVEKERAVVRNDTGQMFGVVGAEHKILTNAAFFDIADTLLDTADLTWADAQPFGGARAKGAAPFLAFQLPSGIQVAGKDAVGCGVLLNNGHVGNTAATLSVLPIRNKCSNIVTPALRAARKGNAAGHVSIQHSGDIGEKVKIALLALEMTTVWMREFAETADRLAAAEMNLSEFDDFLADLIPLDPAAGDRAKATVAARRGALRSNWATPTLDDDLRATRWGALNIVTEVLQHGDTDVRRSAVSADERRLNSVVWGSGATVRERAYNLLGAG